MKSILNLTSNRYYTQRNNPTITGFLGYQLNANAQCMNTSYVMFLVGNNIPFENPTAFPHDTYFGKLLLTKDAREFAAKKYPWSVNRKDSKGQHLPDIPPNQIHGMYGSYLSPIVCGRRVSDFKTNLYYQGYVERINNRQVIMTSGEFREAGIDGHAFCVIGTYYRGVWDLRLADPWGNYKNNYETVYGFDTRMNELEFMEHVKPANQLNKWGHVVL